MITEKQTNHISKFLSYVLRHHPEKIDIQLDQNGWAAIDELITKADNYGIPFDREILHHVVAKNSKKRFTFNDKLDKIRASQGHSVNIELGYTNQKPPEMLFHGTNEKSVESILNTGIEKRSRQHVHLSSDTETAIKVGKRHGKPFVFKVLATQMYMDNFQFFLADNGVWLTENVPAKYLK
ncbi:MAG: RNA 2'-phosphotransferase [Pelobium sp.]